MVSVPRHPPEQWVDYIQRATHRSLELANRHGATNWTVLQKERKWALAGKVASSSDGRWAHRLLDWKPWFRAAAQRSVGHPHKRWDDDLVAVVGGDWPAAVRDPLMWCALGVGFANGI